MAARVGWIVSTAGVTVIDVAVGRAWVDEIYPVALTPGARRDLGGRSISLVGGLVVIVLYCLKL